MNFQIPKLSVAGLPHFTNFNGLSFLSFPILVGILIVFFVLYLIVTLILMYHWSEYGMKSRGVIFGRLVFLCGSAFLFFVAITALNLVY